MLLITMLLVKVCTENHLHMYVKITHKWLFTLTTQYPIRIPFKISVPVCQKGITVKNMVVHYILRYNFVTLILFLT